MSRYLGYATESVLTAKCTLCNSLVILGLSFSFVVTELIPYDKHIQTRPPALPKYFGGLGMS